MQIINKIRNCAALLVLLAGVQLGASAQGMLGKRLSADVYMGFAPKLPVLYSPIISEGPNAVSPDYQREYGLTTWNFNASLNYVLGKRWEASLGFFGWRDYSVVDILEPHPFSTVTTVAGQTKPVTISYNLRLTPTRQPLTYYGTELSWKYYTNTFNSSEAAPAGIYYRIGFGVTRYSAQIDRDAIKENLRMDAQRATVPSNNPNGPGVAIPFPLSRSQAADLWLNQMDLTELKSLNFHVVYGFGYQRFLGNKLYTKVGFEGRAPFFILNEYYEVFEAPAYNTGYWGGSRTNKEYFQDEAISRARKGQWIKFTFGVGYMLY